MLLIIGLLMKVFLGNDEQWEELLAEEARLAAAEAMNDTMTEVDGGVADVAAALMDNVIAGVTGDDAFISDEF